MGMAEQFDRVNRALTSQMERLKDTVLALAGGVHPANLIPNLWRTDFNTVYMAESSSLSILGQDHSSIGAGQRCPGYTIFKENAQTLDRLWICLILTNGKTFDAKYVLIGTIPFLL